MCKRFFGVLLASVLATATLAQTNKWEMGNPNNSNYDYLKTYGNLKDYIDHTKYPNFKLGAGTTAYDYNQKNTVYNMTNANFSETVAGNAMKMASCVNNNGSMNFSTVKSYVNNATAAGLNVYGHCLAWHSQQAVGWLSSLLKDHPAVPLTDGDVTIWTDLFKKDFRTNQSVGWHSDYSTYNYNITFDSTNGMKVTNTKKATNNYDVQYIAADNIPVTEGEKVKLLITVKGSSSGTLHYKFGGWNSGNEGNIQFTDEWKTYEFSFKSVLSNSFLMLQSGHFVGDIYVKDVTVQNATVGQTVVEQRRCIEIDADARVNDATDNQFWIITKTAGSGSTYEFTADIRAEKEATVSTQLNKEPGTPSSRTDALGDITFTTNWTKVTKKGYVAASSSSIAFNLSEFEGANKYYFDNISLKINDVERVVNGDLEGTSVESFKQKTARGEITDVTIADSVQSVYIPTATPLTAEEVHDTLVWAMEKWIKGMMEACNGKVKGWDLVNEPISGGGNDGSGNYILQHRNGYVAGANQWDVGGDAFYWQDYMGDLEYVRQACRLARKYGPEDVKLFINDYNLESTWDSNKKVKSLIGWIKKWESDGVTKIDGIGTQMHISYYLDSESQANQKKCITKMFELLAASGKLVRVSELDMGICDRQFGTSIKTADVTEEQHKMMADYYKWIYQEYLRIIPPAQQWGVCQWCTTDAPSNSGWRGGEPVGYWDLNYYRKHTYAGVCEGLGGINYVSGIEEVTTDKSLSSSNTQIYNLSGQRVTNPTHGIFIVNGKKVLVK